jgi:hypothetical protein
VRARARGPKRATSDKPPGFIGRSDPFDAQGSGAKSRGTWRAECGDGHPLTERPCIPRDGRDVRGPTCGRGSAGGDRRRGSWPASRAPRWRASFRSGRSSAAMAAPSVKPGARRRGGRGARRPVGGGHARPVTDPRPRARALARRPSGRDACLAVVASRHAACPRGQARVKPPSSLGGSCRCAAGASAAGG